VALLNYQSSASEETIFHAQKIIDFFGNSLRDNGCLSHIPATLYAEADHHIDKIEAITSAVNTPVAPVSPAYANDPIRAAIRRAAGRDCLDCKPKMPLIQFEGMKGQVAFDAKDFIAKMKSIKSGGFSGSLPTLAFLFGSFCIPDLIKLLSLLLASVIRLTFSLDITKFSFMALLTAILKRLLANLLTFSNMSVKLSLSPIMCILDALVQLNNSLVSDQSGDFGLSINKDGVSIDNASQQERADRIAKRNENETGLNNKTDATIFLGTSVRSTSITVKNFHKVEAWRNGIKRKLPEQKDIDSITQTVSQVQDVINKGLIDMESYIGDIFAIGRAIQCESERSTKKASDAIEAVIQYISLINLIRSVIKKKTRNIAQNVMGSPELQYTGQDKFTYEDVAEVVGDISGKLSKVYNTDAGNTGILISTIPSNTGQDALSLYSCNINDFIKESHMDNIIEDAKIFAEDNLVGKGNPPSYFTDEYVMVNGDEFIPFNINEDDILSQVSDIFKFLNIKNPYDTEAPRSHDLKNLNKIGNILPVSPVSTRLDSILGDIGRIRI